MRHLSRLTCSSAQLATTPRAGGALEAGPRAPSRRAARWACAGAWLVTVALAACSSVDLAQPTEPLTSVDTWQLKMTRRGANDVVIAYSPPLSAQRQYTGANHQSDGKTLIVSLRSCLVEEECPTLLPAQTRNAADQSRWFEVVVPYQGERVVVDGDGPGTQVLTLTPP